MASEAFGPGAMQVFIIVFEDARSLEEKFKGTAECPLAQPNTDLPPIVLSSTVTVLEESTIGLRQVIFEHGRGDGVHRPLALHFTMEFANFSQ